MGKRGGDEDVVSIAALVFDTNDDDDVCSAPDVDICGGLFLDTLSFMHNLGFFARLTLELVGFWMLFLPYSGSNLASCSKSSNRKSSISPSEYTHRRSNPFS